MSLFVTVVIQDLTYVLLLCSMFTNFRFVDSGGRGRVLIDFLLLLLLFFPGLIGRLKILGGSRYRRLSFGFVPAITFHCSLGLDLVCVGMDRSIPLGDLLVGLLYIKTWS